MSAHDVLWAVVALALVGYFVWSGRNIGKVSPEATYRAERVLKAEEMKADALRRIAIALEKEVRR